MYGVDFKLEGEFPDYEKILSRWCASAARQVRDRMREKLREPKHGRRYKKVYKSGAIRYQTSSAPGESPARWFGDLDRSLKVEVNRMEAFLYSNDPKAAWLEEGTKRIKPRPWWQATVDEMMPSLEAQLMEMMENGR